MSETERPRGSSVELPQDQHDTGKKRERRGNLEIVARRVLRNAGGEQPGAIGRRQRVAILDDGLLQIGDIELAGVRDAGATCGIVDAHAPAPAAAA